MQVERRLFVEAVIGHGCGNELARRLTLVAPALARMLAEEEAEPEMTLRRNVVAHAERLPAPGRGAAAWREAQQGPCLARRPRAQPTQEAVAREAGCGLPVGPAGQ